jgi:hypothetical protein
MQFSIRSLLICTALFALGVWFVRSAYLGFTQVETGEAVRSVDWLPEAASNVSYFRSYLNTAYEFDIDEAGFREWAWWELAEISEPVRLSRYLAFSTPHPVEPTNPTKEEWEAFAVENDRRGITIVDGLYYGEQLDNGGGVWVAYDRRLGRAYFQSAPR